MTQAHDNAAHTGDDAESSLRVLVTGGSGFIGSHLVDRLLARGDHVTVVDNLSTGQLANLNINHPNLRFIEASLDAALHSFGPGEVFDEVYHLAAAVGVTLIIEDPIGSIHTNVEQTAALLKFISQRASPEHPASTLIASSSEVYGKGEHSPFREDDDVLYGPTTVGRWSYACSKAIDEYLAMAYCASHQCQITVARFFNTVGPRQIGRYGMVLPRFVAAAITNEQLTIFGDGTQSRCFCDVRDVAGVLPHMVAEPKCCGSVFNVGSDEPITIEALADLVIEVTGSASSKRFIPYEAAYASGFEDLKQRRPDLSRIKNAVGFEPKIPLVNTIRDLADQIRGTSASVKVEA
jgi:nucleoside-diphosphate-sugar epimerase